MENFNAFTPETPDTRKIKMTATEKIKFIHEDVNVELQDCEKQISETESQITRLEIKLERLREAKQLAERLQGKFDSYEVK